MTENKSNQSAHRARPSPSLTLSFLVQGSAPDPYSVTFELRGTNISAYCTCPAGENGMHCKHRLSILAGDFEAISSPNVDRATVVASWLAGSNIETALYEHAAAEAMLALAQKNLSDTKKKLAATMR